MTDWRNVSADIFPHSAFSDTKPHHCSSTTNFCTHPRPTCHHHHSLSQPQPAPPSTPLSTNIQLRIGRDTNPHFDWKSLSRQTWFRNSSFFHDSILQSLQNKILISALWLCLSLTRARWLSLSLWSQEARSRCRRENESQDISQCPLVQDKPDTFTQNRTVGRPPAVIVTVNIFLTRIFVSTKHHHAKVLQMHIFQNFVANVNHNRSPVECSGKEVIIKSKSIVPGVVYRGHYCGCCKTVGLRWPGATFMLRLSVAQAFLTPTKCHSSWNTNTNWVSVLHGEAFKINLADLLPLPLKISKKSAGFGGAPLHPSAENLLLWPRKISPTTAKKVLSDMSTQGCQNFCIMHWRSIFLGLIGQLVCVTSELLQLGQKCGQLQTVFHQPARMSDKGMRSVNVVS